jgi:hypothetical protein
MKFIFSSLQVLLDSEGIESSGQSDKYMAQLFAMCILFSSTFVYNHIGILDNSLIEALSVAATILQEITGSSACCLHSLGLYLFLFIMSLSLGESCYVAIDSTTSVLEGCTSLSENFAMRDEDKTECLHSYVISLV